MTPEKCEGMVSTIIRSEIEKFSSLADQWWDGKEFAILHKINPVRITYMLEHLDIAPETRKNINLLDIGCGGGILSESLARIGFKVTGIDPSEESIENAKKHAKSCGVDIDYHCTDIEEFLLSSTQQYDVITVMEVLEHVTNLERFIEETCKLLKKGGTLFLSTINRTAKSFLFGIIAAEYLLKWVPRGTHNWNKFIKPSELCEILIKQGIKPVDISSMDYTISTNSWHLKKNHSPINYFVTAKN